MNQTTASVSQEYTDVLVYTHFICLYITLFSLTNLLCGRFREHNCSELTGFMLVTGLCLTLTSAFHESYNEYRTLMLLYYIGVFLMPILIVGYLQLFDKVKKTILSAVISPFPCVAAILLYISPRIDAEQSKIYVEAIWMGYMVSFFASPVMELGRVIKEKKTSFLPFITIAGSFITSCVQFYASCVIDLILPKQVSLLCVAITSFLMLLFIIVKFN